MDSDRTPEPAAVRGTTAGTCYSVHPSQSGDARATVVLIHGVGMNQSVWAPQITPLTTAGYDVLAYDMLGHGGSALPPAEPTLHDYAGQLERLLDALGIRRAHIAGHSMGALVALEFALSREPRTLSVAALNAVYDRSPAQREAVMSRAATLGESPSDANSHAGVDATLKRWFGDPAPAHLTQAAQAVRHLLLTVDPIGYARTYRLFACSDDVHVGRLASLAVRALFLTGECDQNSSPDMSRAMAAAAPSGHAEIIRGARHMMNVSHPNEVSERLLRFFGAIAGNAATQHGNTATPNIGDDHV